MNKKISGLDIVILASLVIFSIICFLLGQFGLVGITISPIFLLIGIIFSIFYIIKSVKNHRFIFLSLYLPLLIVFLFLGILSDKVNMSNTKKYILNASITLEKYYQENSTLPVSKENLKALGLENAIIEDLGKGNFIIKYKDAIFSNTDNKVYFRPRP